MTAMTATTECSSGSGPFTVADLERMPDDGRRYELLDGALLVSPAPGGRHQKIVAMLICALQPACPDDMHVLPAPFAVRPSGNTELQPDVLVTSHGDMIEKFLPVAPELVVEVLSPSTAINDLNNKKAAYQRMGVPSYWVIDPAGPSLLVFELDAAGEYQTIAKVEGEGVFEAQRPFQVQVSPAALLGTLR